MEGSDGAGRSPYHIRKMQQILRFSAAGSVLPLTAVIVC